MPKFIISHGNVGEQLRKVDIKMSIGYYGLHEINGPLIVIENVKDISYDEVATIIEKW